MIWALPDSCLLWSTRGFRAGCFPSGRDLVALADEMREVRAQFATAVKKATMVVRQDAAGWRVQGRAHSADRGNGPISLCAPVIGARPWAVKRVRRRFAATAQLFRILNADHPHITQHVPRGRAQCGNSTTFRIIPRNAGGTLGSNS